MTRADRTIAIGLFVVALITYAWFFPGGGFNQNAHFDLTRALVERQTLHIDGYNVNTGDVSWRVNRGAWHVYINKPPGASVLAAVPYALIYGVERVAHVLPDSWLAMTVNSYLTTLLTCGVMGALIPVVLYIYARRRVGASMLVAVSVALTIAFGTIVMPYSTMLFAHVPATFFLLLAFVLLEKYPLLAGIAAGIAGTCFYICIPAAAVLAIASAPEAGAAPPTIRRVLRFVAGGLPFGILLALYQYLCFGSPFTTSSETSQTFTHKGLLLGLFQRPTFEALWGLTFPEYRGLFFSSPILLLAVIGAVIMIRRRTMLRELAVIAAIVFVFFFVFSGYSYWPGGNAWGPRFILPIVPLLAIPMLFAWRSAFLIVSMVCVTMQFLATAIDPMPPGNIAQPLRKWILPAFARGEVAINAQCIDERAPYFIYPPGSKQSQWAAFNLGEFITGPSRRSSLIPVALWMLFGSTWLVYRSWRCVNDSA